jgi:hypothetical protein
VALSFLMPRAKICFRSGLLFVMAPIGVSHVR